MKWIPHCGLLQPEQLEGEPRFAAIVKIKRNSENEVFLKIRNLFLYCSVLQTVLINQKYGKLRYRLSRTF